jgi:hypothetical protein
VGTSLYLAIAVLIMLIIITVMVFSLKDINKSIANINVVSFYFILFLMSDLSVIFPPFKFNDS